jgi:hypothetical protein
LGAAPGFHVSGCDSDFQREPILVVYSAKDADCFCS